MKIVNVNVIVVKDITMIKLKTLIEQEVKKADYSMELHFDHIDNLTDKIEKSSSRTSSRLQEIVDKIDNYNTRKLDKDL